MPHSLRRLLFGLIAALLLLQPAVRAGAGCAVSLFTGTCPCTAEAEANAADGAPSSCCETETTGSDQDERAPSKCGCEVKAPSELPTTPRTASFDAEHAGLLDLIQVSMAIAPPELRLANVADAPRPPGRDADPANSRGPTTARRLALLQVSLR